ncbi:cysteine three histidine 1 [Xenentodon cancila]
MFETSTDDLFWPSPQDEELVENLCNEDWDEGGSPSTERASLPLVEVSPPLASNWVCSTRYKTELCTGYSTAGFCKYAERCQFAHGLHELHVPFRHPKYKTELCRSYHTTGYCYYGSRCLFVHNPAEQRKALRHRNVPCRTFFSFGVCPFGTHCNFLHDEGRAWGSSVDLTDCDRTSPAPCAQIRSQSKEWKPQGTLCHTFSSFGFCLYGTRCRFQHGLPSKIKAYDKCSLDPSSPVPNALTSSSQRLNNLLPLTFRLQQLERTNTQGLGEDLL